MKRLLLGGFAALLVNAPLLACADTVFLLPQVQGRKQVCFLNQIHGYISEFDGKRFRVQVVLTGCEGDRKVPIDCTPFLLAKGGPVPPELMADVAAPSAAVLEAEFSAEEVLSVEFNGTIYGSCSERQYDPHKGKKIPNIVRLDPTMVADETVFSKADLESLGVKGRFVGMNWAAGKETTGIKLASAVSIVSDILVDSGPQSLTPGEKIALGAVLWTSIGQPQYYILDGTVKSVAGKKFAFEVVKIVHPGTRTKSSSTGEVRRARLQPVLVKGERAQRVSLPWLGLFRGAKAEVPLDLRRIRLNGGRVAEIGTGVPMQQESELLQLKKSP